MTAAVAPAVRHRLIGVVRRALGEFLGLPILVLLAFVAFAAAVHAVDRAAWSDGRHPEGLGWLAELLGDTAALGSLLATVATSIITVTSITFSLLLLAVQQGAAALTSQVFDQFLRRRPNQFYFGFFVGLSVYVLLTLVTVSAIHRPIFGALAALLLTSAALCMVVVLIYNTIDQMRPTEIVKAIHQHTLLARGAQRPLLEATRRRPRGGLPFEATVEAEDSGILSAIEVEALKRALAPGAGGDAAPSPPAAIEVEVLVGVGAYVAFRDPLLRLRSDRILPEPVRRAVEEAAVSAVRFEDARDLNRDPSFGIEQLATIGWTSASTARSNPQPAILVCRSLRDILARWAAEGPPPEDPESPVVYADRAPEEAVAALESLAVVASESMQHQTLAEVVRSLATLLPVLPRDLSGRVEDAALRTLSALGEHVLTGELEEALRRLEHSLRQAGRGAGAEAVQGATAGLRRSLGRLNSRSTRVPGA